jgi:signal transduction histidine kinase
MRLRNRFVLLFFLAGVSSVLLFSLLLGPVVSVYEDMLNRETFSERDLAVFLEGTAKAVAIPETGSAAEEWKEWQKAFLERTVETVRRRHPGLSGMVVQVLDSRGRVVETISSELSAGAEEKIKPAEEAGSAVPGNKGAASGQAKKERAAFRAKLKRGGLEFDRYTIGDLGELFGMTERYGNPIDRVALVPLAPGTEKGGAADNAEASAAESEAATHELAPAAPGSLLGAVTPERAPGFTLSLRESGFSLLLLLGGTALLCVFGITLAIIYMGTRSLLTRFERLNAGLAKVRKGDYDFRLEERGADELAFLVSTFNLMIDELARRRDERKRMEEEKRRIIASISHDLRTPLSSVYGYAESLRDVPDVGAGEVSSQAEVIRSKAEYMEQLLEELLDYSASDAAASQLTEEELDLCELLRTAVIGFLPQMRSKGIDPVIDVPENSGWVRGDRTLLSRAFENLLKNAVSHARDGTALRVGLRRQRDSAELTEKAPAWRVVVTNTGTPIPEEERGRIFDAFYRADASRREGGLGLGLSIARRIVEQHGGTLGLAESSGQHTVFEAMLPAAD